MTTTLVRPARPEDLSAILALGEGFHTEMAHYRAIPYDRSHTEGFVLWFIGHDRRLALVACQSDQIVGFFLGHLARLAFSPAPAAVDAALYVLPKHRGAVGGQLVDAFIEWATPHTALMVMTETAGAAPEAYDRLVKQRGFTPAGTIYHRRSAALGDLEAVEV
jgi:GNAT superfamily N-acetyltransferase